MHITATCPACQSQYQVDPNLRGKRMRCPNAICRTVFEVTDGTPVAVPTAPPAKVVAPPKPKWSAPPPVRVAAAPAMSPPPLDDFDIPGDDDVGRVSDPSPSEPNKTVSSSPGLVTGRVGDPSHASPKKSRHPLLYVGVVAGVIAVVAVVVAQHFASQKRQAESGIEAKAQELYRAGDFAEATKRFQQLQRDYPDSPQIATYRFMATLSELRAEVDAANDAVALADGRKHAVEFLDNFQDLPPFKPREGEVFETLLQLVKRSVRSLQETPDGAALKDTKSIWERGRKLAGDNAKEDAEFGRAFAAVGVEVELRERRKRLLDDMRQLPPTAATIAALRGRIAAAKMADDAEIVAGLKALKDRHVASLVFVPPGDAPPPVTGDGFDVVPLVASLQTPQAARGREPIVALSPSGVLYGIDPKKGSLIWEKRLGIDSRTYPLQVAHRADAPAIVVVSNDQKFIALLDVATGKDTWRQNLAAPVAVEPFVAAGKLLAPLVTGRVDVFDLVDGKPQGSFQLDQALATAGTTHPGTTLVSAPGAANCVYVLDLADHSVAVVETDHAAGSLIGPPIIVPSGEKREWIVLALAESGPRVRLRPVEFLKGDGRPRTEKDFVIPGTLSFPPRHDAESILLATEDGRLHRVGLRLPGNNDPLLFKLTPAEIALDAPPPGRSTSAQVVHADAENVWVMSGGRLQRLQESFSPKSGPTVKLRWPRGTPLGDPLHAPQVHVDGEGTLLFLTTHDPESTSARLSAVDAETGKILWQTQLGSVPRADPLVIGDEIVWDDGAALFRGKLSWEKVPSLSAVFQSLPFGGARAARSVLLNSDKKLVRVAWSPDQPKLTFVQFDVGVSTLPSSRDVKLPAPVAGRPILLDDGLVVPLTSGQLIRIDHAGTTTPGPDWRVPGSDVKFPHLVRIRPDRFVVSKGNGLVAYEWANTWKEIAQYRPADRVVTGRPFRVGDKLLVDAAGTLLLLDDRLQPIGRKDWSLKGKITAGPFAVGANVMMVVDGKRLIALDVGRDGFLWDVAFLSDVAAAPRLVGDRLVVTDLGGNFWTLDPATGENLTLDDRPALSVRANIAAAASPIVLPDGKLLVLWSDGTAGLIAIP